MEEAKKRILIVDDDDFLLDMYALKFEESGFLVETASNAKKALEKLKEDLKIDIILLDIVMPNMDGFELLEEIKNNNLIPEAYKIVLSNKGQEEDVKRGQEVGADGYIVKANSTPKEVIEKVEKIISKNKEE